MQLQSAECVSPLHPDKLCDRIADAILDECLRQDPDSRVAVEVMGGHGIITITGEVTTNAYVDMRKIARCLAGDKYGVQVNVVEQSPEIESKANTGAGDQGVMVGYACRENDTYVPLEAYLARSLCHYLWQAWEADGKTQVTIDENGKIYTVVASWCGVEKEKLLLRIKDWLVEFGANPETTTIHANPGGDWKIGGFEADTGLTGRKLAVDNYGPRIPIGGGAFSGKDPSKVDRSGAYMARKIAVDVLDENSGAKFVFVQIAYAIGIAEPVAVDVLLFDENKAPINDVNPTPYAERYDLTPNGIINFLQLRRPQYEQLAAWGHFGRIYTCGQPWEIAG